MMTKSSDDFLTNLDWFEHISDNEPLVFSHTSALECHELFSGYMRENDIYAYAEKTGKFENIHYITEKVPEDGDISKIGNIRCTTVSRTINDMLEAIDTDEQALIEALARYYYQHNESFEGIKIKKENISQFNSLIDSAVEYYDEG